MWDLPRPGLEPVSPALAGRLSTTAPPGKPPEIFLNDRFPRQHMDWKKILANDVTNKGLISEVYKQLIQLNIKKKRQPHQKMGRKLKYTFLQRRHTEDQQAYEKMLSIANY